MKRLIAAIMVISFIVITCCSCAHTCREVRTAEINEKGELILIFTDGTTSNVGMVKGADGAPGADGKDGANGKDGADGKDGATGEKGDTGLTGTEGRDGSSIESVSMNEDGALVITYDDGTFDTVDTYGELYLFGGKCGDNAQWALYNGGILVISGSGSTAAYEEGKTPWYSIIPMMTAVYVDRSDGLIEGEGLLYGIDESIIARSEATSTRWVDMTVAADVYATADKTAEPIGSLPLGSELGIISESDGFVKIIYNGAYGYMESQYAKDNYGSVVYDPASCQLTVVRDTGANVRTFPDATGNSTGNTYANIPYGSVLNCTGISKNGNWYRISYEGQTLYAYHTWVDEK